MSIVFLKCNNDCSHIVKKNSISLKFLLFNWISYKYNSSLKPWLRFWNILPLLFPLFLVIYLSVTWDKIQLLRQISSKTCTHTCTSSNLWRWSSSKLLQGCHIFLSGSVMSLARRGILCMFSNHPELGWTPQWTWTWSFLSRDMFAHWQ